MLGQRQVEIILNLADQHTISYEEYLLLYTMNLKEAVHINRITPQPEWDTRKISQTPTSGFVYENCYTIVMLTIKLNYYVEYLTVFEHSHKNVNHLSLVTHQRLLCTLQ